MARGVRANVYFNQAVLRRLDARCKSDGRARGCVVGDLFDEADRNFSQLRHAIRGGPLQRLSAAGHYLREVQTRLAAAVPAPASHAMMQLLADAIAEVDGAKSEAVELLAKKEGT